MIISTLLLEDISLVCVDHCRFYLAFDYCKAVGDSACDLYFMNVVDRQVLYTSHLDHPEERPPH